MIAGILAFLGGISGGIVMNIVKALGLNAIEQYRGYLTDKMNSETEREKIRTSLYIKSLDAEIDARRNARDIRLATAGFWEMRLLTFLIAAPFIWHLWMVFLDTAFGWYRLNCWFQEGVGTVCGVPAFPSPFKEWEGAILLSFFGVQVGLSMTQAIVGAYLKGRK